MGCGGVLHSNRAVQEDQTSDLCEESSNDVTRAPMMGATRMHSRSRERVERVCDKAGIGIQVTLPLQQHQANLGTQSPSRGVGAPGGQGRSNRFFARRRRNYMQRGFDLWLLWAAYRARRQRILTRSKVQRVRTLFCSCRQVLARWRFLVTSLKVLMRICSRVKSRLSEKDIDMAIGTDIRISFAIWKKEISNVRTERRALAIVERYIHTHKHTLECLPSWVYAYCHNHMTP